MIDKKIISLCCQIMNLGIRNGFEIECSATDKTLKIIGVFQMCEVVYLDDSDSTDQLKNIVKSMKKYGKKDLS